MSSRRRKMSEDNDSSSEDSAGSDVEDDVGTEPASTFFPILDSVNSSGGAAAAAAAAALKEGDQVEENGCEGESDASAVSDDEDTASVISSTAEIRAEGGEDEMSGDTPQDLDNAAADEDQETLAAESTAEAGLTSPDEGVEEADGDVDAIATVKATEVSRDIGDKQKSKKDENNGGGVPASESEVKPKSPAVPKGDDEADLGAGEGWGAAEGEGAGEEVGWGADEGEEDETAEEKEARLVAYAAQQEEEYAIRQERKAMRENPAIIPKRGGFFVHDDRSASSVPTASSTRGVRGVATVGEDQDTAEQEDDDVGRWRADTVPASRKGGRDRTSRDQGSRGRKADADDDDLPWGHEGFEEVIKAEEEGREISKTSGFWSNPTGRSERSGGSWRAGAGGGDRRDNDRRSSFQQDGDANAEGDQAPGNRKERSRRSEDGGTGGRGGSRSRGGRGGRGKGRGTGENSGARGRGRGGGGGYSASPAPAAEAWPTLGGSEIPSKTGTARQADAVGTGTAGSSSKCESPPRKVESGGGWGDDPSGDGGGGSGWEQAPQASVGGRLVTDEANGGSNWGDTASGGGWGRPGDGAGGVGHGWDQAPQASVGGRKATSEQHGWPKLGGQRSAGGGRGKGGGSHERRSSQGDNRGGGAGRGQGSYTDVASNRNAGSSWPNQQTGTSGSDWSQGAVSTTQSRSPTTNGWGGADVRGGRGKGGGGWGQQHTSGSPPPATSGRGRGGRGSPRQRDGGGSRGRTGPAGRSPTPDAWTSGDGNNKSTPLASGGAGDGGWGDSGTNAASATTDSSVPSSLQQLQLQAKSSASPPLTANAKKWTGKANTDTESSATAAAASSAGAPPSPGLSPSQQTPLDADGTAFFENAAVPSVSSLTENGVVPLFVPPVPLSGLGFVDGGLGALGGVGGDAEALAAPLSSLPPEQRALILHAQQQQLVAQQQMQRAQLIQLQQVQQQALRAQQIQQQEQLRRMQMQQDQIEQQHAGAKGGQGQGQQIQLSPQLQNQQQPKPQQQASSAEIQHAQAQQQHHAAQAQAQAHARQRQMLAQHQQQQHQQQQQQQPGRQQGDDNSSSNINNKPTNSISNSSHQASKNVGGMGAVLPSPLMPLHAPGPQHHQHLQHLPHQHHMLQQQQQQQQHGSAAGSPMPTHPGMAASPPLLVGQVMPHPHHMAAAGPGGAMVPIPMGMPPPPGVGVAMGPQNIQMQQGLFNPAAAGYFMGPGGQPLPMRVAAEMSGAGGGWYPPDQHTSPVPVAWGSGEDPMGASGGSGSGGGLVMAEDVVLPPQADSWMRAAVQQELMREQLQNEQAVVQQQHQYQQQIQHEQLYGSSVDPSQQPLLNAQAMAFEPPPIAGEGGLGGDGGGVYFSPQLQAQQTPSTGGSGGGGSHNFN